MLYYWEYLTIGGVGGCNSRGRGLPHNDLTTDCNYGQERERPRSKDHLAPPTTGERKLSFAADSLDQVATAIREEEPDLDWLQGSLVSC